MSSTCARRVLPNEIADFIDFICSTFYFTFFFQVFSQSRRDTLLALGGGFRKIFSFTACFLLFSLGYRETYVGFDLLGYVSYGTGRYGFCITFCRLSGWFRLYIVNAAMSNKYCIHGLGLLPRNLQPPCSETRNISVAFLRRLPMPED